VFPLHLYARVRISLCIIAHETAGAARTRSSLRPLLFRGVTICMTRTKSSRGIAEVCLAVIASEAKQSSVAKEELDCFVASAPRNDEAIVARSEATSGKTAPAYRGACHRARIRATRWLMRATGMRK
jgi:hypothetical protein